MSVCFFVPAEQGGVSNASDDPGDVEGGIGDAESQSSDTTQLTLAQFWSKVMDDMRKVTADDFKTQVLPLARIKKIMKLDEDVKMISAEAPMLFAKAAEIFIHELTLRAWVHTEDNKRRTLQRNDIAMAIAKSDQFDFLIDIVPRQEVKPAKTRDDPANRTAINSDQVHYYFQLAQQHQAALQAPQTQLQILQPHQLQQLQTMQQAPAQQVASTSAASAPAQAPVVVSSSPAPQSLQIVQQVVTPGGELHHVPIQLSQAQLNMIRMQMQSNNGQPIILQTQPQQQIIQVQSSQQQQQPQQVFLTQVATGQDTD